MRRVLVADDDPGVVGLIQAVLKDEGYEVLTATDGEEALALARSHNPDVVLLDVMMPRLDGLEVCRRLRDNPATSHLCVIMLTARTMAADQLGGLDAGADDYVSKPFDALGLPTRIQSVLERARSTPARDPLTRLPGPHTIDEMRKRLRDDNTSFALLHVDLDDFSSFDASFGKERGDEAVRLLAACVHQAVEEASGLKGLVGHLAADRLAVIVDLELGEATASAIVAGWETQRSAGDGDLPFVSVGAALCFGGCSGDDAATAVQATREAKSTPGCSFVTKEVPRAPTDELPAEEPDLASPLLRRARKGGVSPRLWDQLAALNDVTRRAERASVTLAEHPRSVLIVDDDPDIRDVLRLHCELQGFPVIAEAANGREGVKLAELHHPTFVLLDYRMPGMDGEETATRIRAVHPEVKIIAFSGVLWERPSWADGFLAKDHIAEVSPLLGRFLEMGAAERRRRR